MTSPPEAAPCFAKRTTNSLMSSAVWEISISAQLCYLGSATPGADLSSRVLHGETLANSEDLLIGWVVGFTADIVTRIPRLAHVEHILRHHRSQTDGGSDNANVPFGARLLAVITSLAGFEATTHSRQEAANALLGMEASNHSLVVEVLDLYLPVGGQVDSVVDLIGREESGS